MVLNSYTFTVPAFKQCPERQKKLMCFKVMIRKTSPCYTEKLSPHPQVRDALGLMN